MSVFVRRFTSDPGTAVLTEIEAVDILDLDPPANLAGVGSGTVLLVGEFENGPFAASEGVTEVTSGTDLLRQYGGFGFIYDGVVANNPAARSRKADGALLPEFWNGNGFIALANKKFKRLLIGRVDTNVGSVQFTRQACLLGSVAPTFDLEPGQTLVYDLGAGAVVNTFTAAAATLVSGVGVYPTLFVGGETLVLRVDENTPGNIGPVTVVFTAADQTQAQVIARINAALGYTAAVDSGGGVTTFSGRVRGLAGRFRVVSGSAAALAAISIAAGLTVGTGNVQNIDAVTVGEVDTVVAGTDVRFDRDVNGFLRACNALTPGTGSLLFTAATTATGLGFPLGTVSSQPNGFATITSAAGVYPSTFVGGETLTLGFDDGPDVVTTFTVADQTQTQVLARINAAFAAAFPGSGFSPAADVGGAKTRLTGRVNGGQVRVVARTGGVDPLTVTGLVLGTTLAVANVAGTIPAGTRVRNTAAVEWVTMRDIAVRATGNAPDGTAAAGPYSVKVRPALDDGTVLGTVALSVTVVPFPITAGGFAVTNPLPLTAALTEPALDAAYLEALAATLNLSSVAKEDNFIVSARQSNAIRVASKQNALDASGGGARGRKAVIRPPLGTTTRAISRGSAQPGVGGYRDQRVDYAFPGAQTFVPQIAQRGTAGGAGFTADGIIDVGMDVFIASLMSQLNPEENPGQLTSFLAGVLGIERNNPDVQNMGIGDYINFRAAGIMALRMDDGAAIIQSGVTSVDPSVFPNLRNAARRNVADFIQDTIALANKRFGKKLSSQPNRTALVAEVSLFLKGLQDDTRIEGFKIDAKSPNRPETLALGIFRYKVKVRTIPSLDAIVPETQIGETVELEFEAA